MITQGFPIGVLGQGVVAAPYDPGMMTFTADYYKMARSPSGNVHTTVVRFKVSAFSGGGLRALVNIYGTAGRSRPVMLACSSDYADAALRSKILVVVYDSAGATKCQLLTDTTVCDGADHTLFFSYRGTAGAAVFFVDGLDADDAGYAGRVAPATATLETTAGQTLFGSFSLTPDYPYTGELGYIGHREAYLTNPTDFHHPTNGLQQLDESGWTEWGAQPLFWNQYGTMTDNKGSAGNMTAVGTITGPA